MVGYRIRPVTEKTALVATRIFTSVLNGGEACYFFKYISEGFYITITHFVHHLVHIFSAEF